MPHGLYAEQVKHPQPANTDLNLAILCVTTSSCCITQQCAWNLYATKFDGASITPLGWLCKAIPICSRTVLILGFTEFDVVVQMDVEFEIGYTKPIDRKILTRGEASSKTLRSRGDCMRGLCMLHVADVQLILKLGRRQLTVCASCLCRHSDVSLSARASLPTTFTTPSCTEKGCVGGSLVAA